MISEFDFITLAKNDEIAKEFKFALFLNCPTPSITGRKCLVEVSLIHQCTTTTTYADNAERQTKQTDDAKPIV